MPLPLPWRQHRPASIPPREHPLVTMLSAIGLVFAILLCVGLDWDEINLALISVLP